MIRKLQEKDALYMLEWMHDDTINCYFQYPFAEMTLEKVKEFINNSFNNVNQHFAIVAENDEYLGTISLKNISPKNKSAEYAVVVRKKAQGAGVATQATEELLKYAFEELELHKVYLNVLLRNTTAKKFYEKFGFIQEGISKDAIWINGKYETLIWYGIIKKEKEDE